MAFTQGDNDILKQILIELRSISQTLSGIRSDVGSMDTNTTMIEETTMHIAQSLDELSGTVGTIKEDVSDILNDPPEE